MLWSVVEAPRVDSDWRMTGLLGGDLTLPTHYRRTAAELGRLRAVMAMPPVCVRTHRQRWRTAGHGNHVDARSAARFARSTA